MPQGEHHSHLQCPGTWAKPPQAVDTDQLTPNTTSSQLPPTPRVSLSPLLTAFLARSRTSSGLVNSGCRHTVTNTRKAAIQRVPKTRC